MANKRKYTLSVAGEHDPIYKQGFHLFSVSSKQDYIQLIQKPLSNQKLEKFLDASFKSKEVKNG